MKAQYEDRPRRPKVVFWFRAYCFLVAIANLVVIWYLLALLTGGGSRPRWSTDTAFWVISLGLLAILVVPFLVGIFVPRSRWAWSFSLVLIGYGFLVCPPLLVVVIPLVIFWLKPGTKHYFGASAQPTAGGDAVSPRAPV